MFLSSSILQVYLKMKEKGPPTVIIPLTLLEPPMASPKSALHSPRYADEASPRLEAQPIVEILEFGAASLPDEGSSRFVFPPVFKNHRQPEVMFLHHWSGGFW